MANQNQIPDRDQQLARRVGATLNQGQSLSTLDDSLLYQITGYKRSVFQSFETELPSSKKGSWDQIESVIGKNKNRHSSRSEKPPVFNLFSQKSAIWKVAATLLIAVFLSLLYFQFERTAQPDILVSSDSELTSYTFDDGSTIRLRPHSKLFLLEETDHTVHYRLEGEAFFNVTKQENRRFLVDAGPGVVEVVGTSFNVREWGDETIVYLQEGTVNLSNSDGSQNVVLKPGEASSVSGDLTVSTPVETDGTEYTSWQQNELVFNNRTAESIFKELEYHYSIQIIAPDHIKNEVLGGSLSLENRSVSLENLGVVLGGKFSSIGNNIYQFVD